MASQQVEEIISEVKKRGRPPVVKGEASAVAPPNHNAYYKKLAEALELGFKFKVKIDVQVPEDYEDIAEYIKKITPIDFTVPQNEGGEHFLRGLYKCLHSLKLKVFERELGAAVSSLHTHVAGLQAAAEAQEEAEELEAKAKRRHGEAFVRLNSNKKVKPTTPAALDTEELD